MVGVKPSRIIVGFFVTAALVFGVFTVARASETPTPAPEDIARWCAVEQQGAHQLALELRQKERIFNAKEQATLTQSAELQAAQLRLDARIAELKTLRAEIDAQLVKADAEQQARVAALVKMVEANRPGTVSPMFQKLDPKLAVDILNRMNRSKAGKLLTALPPDLAAALAERMTAPIALSATPS